MGSLCSKPGTHSGEHVQLQDLPSPTTKASKARNGTKQTLDQGASAGERPDPRTAAAQAAEQRLKVVCLNQTSRWFAPFDSTYLLQAQTRGTNAANPNRGQLAAKLEASKSARGTAEPQQPERLVVSACLKDCL